MRPTALGLAMLLAAASAPAHAAVIVAAYSAYWAGLPAGGITLRLADDPAGYRDRIEISTVGLPRLVTHFRGTAIAEGRLDGGGKAEPARYDAYYDLRRRRGRRISMRFVPADDGVVADRGPADTSGKPPLPQRFRTDALDPLSAVEAIRGALRTKGRRPGTSFTVPVYDGARRFDVLARVLPAAGEPPGVLHVQLLLRPIAGFKGEASDDGDPDDAPRPVDLQLTDDARLVPIAMRVSLYYLPLTVQLERLCPGSADCPK